MSGKLLGSDCCVDVPACVEVLGSGCCVDVEIAGSGWRGFLSPRSGLPVIFRNGHHHLRWLFFCEFHFLKAGAYPDCNKAQCYM